MTSPVASPTTDRPTSEFAVDLYRRTVLENPFLRDVQVSERQFLFLTWPAREIMYGGAAGGGKSVALLIAALQYVMVPGYNAILFRRTFADLCLPDALIPLSHEFLAGTAAKWNGNDYRWTFPSGATLSFAYLASENDKHRYKGAAFAFCGFDELTQFSKTQYLYLFSRLRKTHDNPVPLRMRAASNPGDVGHQWVYERFVSQKPEDVKARPASCVFVPAKKDENPWLEQSSYDESLNKLDYVTRQQLKHGDWEVRPEGNCFKEGWFRFYERDENCEHYILGHDRKVVRITECHRFATADIAGTEKHDANDPDYTVIQVWDATPNGDLILVYQWRDRFEIPDVEEMLLKVAWDYDVEVCVVEKNGIGLPVVQTVRRRGLAVKPVVAKTNKFARSQSAQIRMEAGSIYFPKGAPYLDELQGELLTFPMDGVHDDQVDALSIAAQYMNKLGAILTDERDEAQAVRVERETADAQADEDRQWREMVTSEDEFGWTDL